MGCGDGRCTRQVLMDAVFAWHAAGCENPQGVETPGFNF